MLVCSLDKLLLNIGVDNNSMLHSGVGDCVHGGIDPLVVVGDLGAMQKRGLALGEASVEAGAWAMSVTMAVRCTDVDHFSEYAGSTLLVSLMRCMHRGGRSPRRA